jgi:adenylate kinase
MTSVSTKQIGLIFGPNGVGKGTLAKHLAETCHLTHINMGNLIREWIHTTESHHMQSLIDEGEMVPDPIVEQILNNRFEEIEKKHHKETVQIVMEGIPRKRDQVSILKNICQKYGYDITWIIVLNAPLDNLLERVKDRVMAPDGNVYHLTLNPPPAHFKKEDLVKRLDDRPHIVKKRYENYVINTLESLSDSFFATVPLFNIDSTQSIAQVFIQAESFLQSFDE